MKFMYQKIWQKGRSEWAAYPHKKQVIHVDGWITDTESDQTVAAERRIMDPYLGFRLTINWAFFLVSDIIYNN